MASLRPPSSAAYILFHITVRREERGAHITVRKDLRSDNCTSFYVLAHKAVRGLENNRKEEVTRIHFIKRRKLYFIILLLFGAFLFALFFDVWHWYEWWLYRYKLGTSSKNIMML